MNKKLNKKNIISVVILVSVIMVIVGAYYFITKTEIEVVEDINMYRRIMKEVDYEEHKYDFRRGINHANVFPNNIDGLDVKDFKSIYSKNVDFRTLSTYLVVEYSENEYEKELERLNALAKDDMKGVYGITGFTNYGLEAVKVAQSLVKGMDYALSDKDNNTIIYVELFHESPYYEFDISEYINPAYLPDNMDASKEGEYAKKYKYQSNPEYFEQYP